MNKTNAASRPTTLEDRRSLADSEVDAVSGGTVPSLGRMIDARKGGAIIVRELRDDELNEVAGGLVVNATIAILLPLLLPDPPKKAG
jgi:hypothetical protein